MVIGLLVLVGMLFVLNPHKLGLLIRAGVENPEMVESLGYRIRRLFRSCLQLDQPAPDSVVHVGPIQRNCVDSDECRTDGDCVYRGDHRRLRPVGGVYCLAIISPVRQPTLAFLRLNSALISHIVLMILVLLWRPAGLYVLGRR